MTKLLTILFIALLPFFVSAQTIYYVSNGGNDANDGLALNTSWQTTDKVNSFNFSPGDHVLFKRGDTFYGSITITESGTAGADIVIGDYGTGNKPIITGFTTVSSWTNLGSNIWESTSAVSTLTACNMVSINGKNTPMGRYPNSSYLTYQSHIGYTSITSSSLTGTPNWTGASVVIKKLRYIISVGTITAQSGGTLTYTDDALYEPNTTNSFGLFIQNDLRTLDVQNEWYYNSTSKKIDVYSSTSPSNVKVASLSNNISISGNYVTIDNLDLQGANSDGIIVSGTHVTVQNCNISYSGKDAINAYVAYLTADNNNISYCNNLGIAGNGSTSNGVLTNNTILSTGVIPGMTQTQSTGAITALGANTLIQYNNIDSSGFEGIYMQGANSSVINNFINHSCLIKDDGGGIYTAFNDGGTKTIANNIILNTVGCIDGVSDGDYMAYGIYLDSYTKNTTVRGNTVANGNATGLFISNADSNIIRDNTVYNNSLQSGFGAQSQAMIEYICCNLTRNNIFNHNTLITKVTNRNAMFMYSNYASDNIPLFATGDSNYYLNPTGGKLFSTQYVTTITDRSFASWKTYTGWDANSSSNSLDSAVNFQYNATKAAVTIPLDYKYKDAANNVYDGTITLQPYTGAVLIQDGDKTTPVADPPIVTTSGDQTLITDSTTVFSTPVAASGQTITATLWTDITGSGSATITSPTTQNTGITGLSVGTHTFRVEVTQSDGQKAHADVSITLNAAPTANAGIDQTITLPTSSVTLSGSGTVASGQTASYEWTKVSGAGTQTITGNTTLTPTISGMTTAGDYVFQLKVTQTDTQFALSTVTVHVNSAPTPQKPFINLRKPTIVIQIH